MNVVFPGSFDPITKGHSNIILKALKIFKTIDIVILNNINKNHLFTLDERKEMILKVFKDFKNVSVYTCEGLLSEYVKDNDVDLLIRGVRNTIDFESEKINARVNKELCGIETMLFFSDNLCEHISSSIIKDVFLNGGNIDLYVDNIVLDILCKKIRRNV